MKPSQRTFLALAGAAGLALPALGEGSPKDLALGEAPILFTQGRDGAALLDGTVATPDEIYLWVPALKFSGAQVDLASTGRFFKLWDSGPVGGPNGNDDNGNELRTLHYEATSGSFLISYDDTTTTGFDAPLNNIADGALLRMTPTAVDAGGFITDWSFTLVYDEGVAGTNGVLTEGDLWGLGINPDGTLIWAGGSTTVITLGDFPITKGSSDLAHTEGLSSVSPRHIESSIFFDGLLETNPGQMRGVDVLGSGQLLISVSNQYSGNQVTVDLDRWDIGTLDPLFGTSFMVYPGELFFETIGTTTAEMLDFSVLDTPGEINALIELLGAASPPAQALRAFADPPPGGFADTMLLTNVEANGLSASIRSLDPATGGILGTFIDSDFFNNGMLLPVSDIKAGPDRTILVAQPGGDGKIARYDELGVFIDNFIGGQPVQANNPVDNIRGMARSGDGAFLFTSDWTGDNIHRFDFETGVPQPIAGDPLGEFIPGGQPPPGLDQPQAMEVLGDGRLLVADVMRRRLVLFDADTGAPLGEFSSNIISGTVTDIDEQPDGTIVIADAGSANRIATFAANGTFLSSFSFRTPAGVHVLPTGDFLVTSGSSFGQGKGLFRVSPTGVILEAIDTSRNYAVLELVTLVEATGCAPDLSGSVDPNNPAFGVPDGVVDAIDFFYYLDRFAAGDLDVADLTGSVDPNNPAFGVPDGTLDANDFFFYLMIFAAGCP